MSVKFLNVDFLILPWAVDETGAHMNHALENDAVDEQGADETKPCVVALFAFEVDTDLVTIDVLIQKKLFYLFKHFFRLFI